MFNKSYTWDDQWTSVKLFANQKTLCNGVCRFYLELGQKDCDIGDIGDYERQ